MGNSLIWVIRIIFIVFSTPEDGTDRLSRNVCKKLQLFIVLYNPEDGSSVTRTSCPHANNSHLETTKYLINRGPVWKGAEKFPPTTGIRICESIFFITRLPVDLCSRRQHILVSNSGTEDSQFIPVCSSIVCSFT